MSQNINVTKQALCNFHTQIQGLKGGIFQYWMNGRIVQFYKDNNLKLEAINRSVNELRLAHFECEDKIKEGEYLYLPKYQDAPLEEGETKPKKLPICLEGKTQEMYQEAYKALMAETTVLTI